MEPEVHTFNEYNADTLSIIIEALLSIKGTMLSIEGFSAIKIWE